MWLAFIFVCATPTDARSCDVMVNTEQNFLTQEACQIEITDTVDYLHSVNTFAMGGCTKIGESV